MKKYEEIKKIGEGTFGEVHKCKTKRGSKIVAIKAVKIDDEAGVPFTTIREIKIFKAMAHSNLVSLIDIFSTPKTINLVMEYMPYDLCGLIAMGFTLTENHIWSFTWQMLSALEYLHSKGVVHRDVKPSNMLLDENGVLKIADFGLSRPESENMTCRVCTLWYRAPELLMGCTGYDHRVDSWGVACIILEMYLKKPFWNYNDEIILIKAILTKLGIPETQYPWEDLFDIKKFKKEEKWENVAKEAFGDILSGEALLLISEMMRVDFKRRLSVSNALKFPLMEKYRNRRYSISLDEAHEFYTRKDAKE
ncbi:CTD kinase subunit alpha [Enteropsectra breve]|nr:CTD kinase subunit alpha [Enteropsectra breve]